MGVHDAFANVETQTGSGYTPHRWRVPSKELIENLTYLIGWNSDSVVFHRNDCPLACPTIGGRFGVIRQIADYALQVESDVTFRGILDRVGDQVD
jgi:hypothetical protein